MCRTDCGHFISSDRLTADERAGVVVGRITQLSDEVHGEDPRPLPLSTKYTAPASLLIIRIVGLEKVLKQLIDLNIQPFLVPAMRHDEHAPGPEWEEVYECIYCKEQTPLDVSDDYVPNVKWHKDACPVKIGWKLLQKGG
jgi:hypothetical protein